MKKKALGEREYTRLKLFILEKVGKNNLMLGLFKILCVVCVILYVCSKNQKLMREKENKKKRIRAPKITKKKLLIK